MAVLSGAMRRQVFERAGYRFRPTVQSQHFQLKAAFGLRKRWHAYGGLDRHRPRHRSCAAAE